MVYCEKVVATAVVSDVRKAKVILVADTTSEITSAMEVTVLPETLQCEKLTVAKMLNGSVCYVPTTTAGVMPKVYNLANGSWVEVKED